MVATSGEAAPPRRRLLGVLAASALGGAAAAAMLVPPVAAAPDPCAPSEIAATVGSVATSTSDYLDANPDINEALVATSQQSTGPQSVAALRAYFDANPKVAGDLQAITAPLTGLSAKCGVPISLPQTLRLLQAAQG
ncbi:hemophore, partial [Mycobacterium sp.]|uniref:hemophore n=1 Tax=Mycobacterium sp. TaxID=1785 RepID=UPI0031D5AF6B